MADGDAGSVRSVLRALRVVERIAEARAARVGELASDLALSKSTVQRVLRTLDEAGWIRPTGDDVTTWEIAPRARNLFQHELPDAALRQLALPVMEALRDSTGETVQLTVPSGANRVTIAERVDSAHEVRSVLPIGTIFDSHEVAGGLALLRADEAATNPPGTIRGAHWVLAPSPTGQSMGLAAVVVDSLGRAVASLVVVIPIDRYRPEHTVTLGASTVAAAGELSRLLGS